MIEQIQNVFRVVFQNSEMLINVDTSAKDIKMWDSLTHLELIASIEKEFNLKFTFVEVMHCDSIQNIITVIQQKSNSKN